MRKRVRGRSIEGGSVYCSVHCIASFTCMETRIDVSLPRSVGGLSKSRPLPGGLCGIKVYICSPRPHMLCCW